MKQQFGIMRIKKSYFINFLMLLIFLTSSFDIFLKIEITGYSIRILYFFEIILFFILLKDYTDHKINSFKLIGWKYLFIWFIFIIIFIPNTTILTRNIGYSIWLFLSILLTGIISTSMKNIEQFFKIFHYYMLSFYLVAIFGLIQFIAGIFGINLLIQQWWITGFLPRINGFNYEPSYFATYLLIGWSILIYLYFSNIRLFSKYRKNFYVITLSLILSSSRMGILTMLLIVAILILFTFFKVIKTKKFSKRYIKFIFLFFGILFIIIFIFINEFEKLKFLFQGLGLFGESSHSSTPRIDGMFETFKVFLKHPFIGVSLGGIPSAIAKLHGEIIHTQLQAKHNTGINIFIQVLAASGIIGFVFFINFFLLLFYKSNKVSNLIKYISFDLFTIIKSLRFALFWELFILCLNQNILRPYLWILIGMVSASIFFGRQILYETKTHNRLENA